MRIEDLKIFVDVAKYHSMNIAAEKNFTTPQNLSKIIKRMEDELGITLLKRSKKGSELTDEGEQFYLHIIEVLQQYNDAKEAISSSNENNAGIKGKKSCISVLCTAGVLSSVIMKAFNEINAEYENIYLESCEITYSDFDYIRKMLDKKEYKILVLYIGQDNLEYFVEKLDNYFVIRLVFDELRFVVSKMNQLSKRNTVLISELSNCELIFSADFDLPISLSENKIEAKILTNSYNSAIEQIIRSKSFAAFMFKSFSRIYPEKFSETGPLRMLKLEKNMYGTYVIAIHKKYLQDDLIKSFVGLIEKCFNE